MIELMVNGEPRTSGSKTAWPNKKTGKPIIAPAGKYQKGWQDTILWAFKQGPDGRMVPYKGALEVWVAFFFVRAREHFDKDGSLSKEGLKYPYPSHKGRRDIDKLQRAAFDALSGYAYEDDGQIIRVHPEKMWADKAGMYIKIRPLQDQMP